MIGAAVRAQDRRRNPTIRPRRQSQSRHRVLGMEQKPTVDVMSAEQTSQTYLTPPSPPLAAVFLRMTPMVWPGAREVDVGMGADPGIEKAAVSAGIAQSWSPRIRCRWEAHRKEEIMHRKD